MPFFSDIPAEAVSPSHPYKIGFKWIVMIKAGGLV